MPSQDDQRAGVQIKIKNDLISVSPGNGQSTVVTIKNLGTQVEEFRFSVTGPQWLAVEPATVLVYPGQEATGTVQAAPPRSPSSTAGVTPFQLTVTSALHAHVSGGAAGRIDVAPYYELAAELIPPASRGRGWTRHHITLDNRGNVPLRIMLNPTDLADGLRLSMPGAVEVRRESSPRCRLRYTVRSDGSADRSRGPSRSPPSLRTRWRRHTCRASASLSRGFPSGRWQLPPGSCGAVRLGHHGECEGEQRLRRADARVLFRGG